MVQKAPWRTAHLKEDTLGHTELVIFHLKQDQNKNTLYTRKEKSSISTWGEGLKPREQSQCSELSHDGHRGLGLEPALGQG